MKKTFRLATGICSAAVFLWLVLRHVSLTDIRAAFAGTRPAFLFVAVVVFFLGYSCRVERWRIMLRTENPAIRWSLCFGPLMASVAANNVLPFRAGDLLRAFAFNRQLGINAAVSLTTLIVERLLDLLMIFAFLGIALLGFGLDSSSFVAGGGASLVVASIVILFALLNPMLFKPMAMWLGRIVHRAWPSLGGKLLGELQKVFDALQYMKRGNVMIQLIVWSALAWTAEGLVFWCAALAMPALVSASAAWFALPVATLSTVIPSTPGYIGSFDYITARAMEALGNAANASTAYALMLHLLLWLPPTIVGGLYLLLKSIGSRRSTEAVPH